MSNTTNPMLNSLTFEKELRYDFWRVYTYWKDMHYRYDGKDSFIITYTLDEENKIHHGTILLSKVKQCTIEPKFLEFMANHIDIFTINKKNICIFTNFSTTNSLWIVDFSKILTEVNKFDSELSKLNLTRMVSIEHNIFDIRAMILEYVKNWYCEEYSRNYSNLLFNNWSDICSLPTSKFNRGEYKEYEIFVPQPGDSKKLTELAKKHDFYPESIANLNFEKNRYQSLSEKDKKRTDMHSPLGLQCIGIKNREKDIVAFCYYTMLNELPYPQQRRYPQRNKKTSCFFISFILVRQDLQGYGIGATLMEAIVSLLITNRNCVLIEVEVNKDDKKSVDFWKKFGYEYISGDDNILYGSLFIDENELLFQEFYGQDDEESFQNSNQTTKTEEWLQLNYHKK